MIYCISDIHGCYDEFMAILEIVNFKPEDTLYILGDAIDRGEESVKCLQFIMSKANIHMLMGNHEKMMIDSLLHNGNSELWQYYNGGDITYKQLRELPESEQLAILEFASNLPYYHIIKIRSKQFLLIHAGLNLQGRPDQEPINKTMEHQDPNTMVWIREEFYSYKALTNYTIVFGHTPTYYLYEKERKHNIWWDTCYQDKIGIDCGCYGGGQLSMLRLDDMQEFYIPKNKSTIV